MAPKMGYFVVFSSKNYLCGVGPFCMYPGANKAGAARPSDLRGEIIKCQTGRPVTRTGDPRLRRFLPGELSRRNYPNRIGQFWVLFGKTPYQITRRQKTAPSIVVLEGETS